MKITAFGAISTIIFASSLWEAPSFAVVDARAALMAEVRVSEAQAKATASAQVPNGTVSTSELKREHGRPVWFFGVAEYAGDTVIEVQVDAVTGKVASVKKETLVPHAKDGKAGEHLLE